LSRSFLSPTDWQGLAEDLQGTKVKAPALLQALDQQLAQLRHGDLPRWRAALDDLPPIRPGFDGAVPAPRLGALLTSPAARDGFRQALLEFHPWRKGPFELAGVTVDTEWRSDWKWDRIASALPWEGATVLDVGCGNGYFGWRMLASGARCVVGIDPTLLFVMQWLVQRHCSGPAPNYVLPLRDTDLPADPGAFDLVLSMGVLYHRRDPLAHLEQLYRCLAPGGRLLLETLVVRGDKPLHPPGRYARMRNVHEVADLDSLAEQLRSAGFTGPELVDVGATTTGEQRSTDWMRFESLAQCLDPADPTRTIEGHPAPRRAVLTARRPRQGLQAL